MQIKKQPKRSLEEEYARLAHTTEDKAAYQNVPIPRPDGSVSAAARPRRGEALRPDRPTGPASSQAADA